MLDNFSKCLKSRERKTRSGAEALTLPKCKLFTQMVSLKDSIVNRPTTSIVIRNLFTQMLFLKNYILSGTEYKGGRLLIFRIFSNPPGPY